MESNKQFEIFLTSCLTIRQSGFPVNPSGVNSPATAPVRQSVEETMSGIAVLFKCFFLAQENTVRSDFIG
jgi:hypothetical protein